jgi:hypothetical protein
MMLSRSAEGYKVGWRNTHGGQQRTPGRWHNISRGCRGHLVEVTAAWRWTVVRATMGSWLESELVSNRWADVRSAALETWFATPASISTSRPTELGTEETVGWVLRQQWLEGEEGEVAGDCEGEIFILLQLTGESAAPATRWPRRISAMTEATKTPRWCLPQWEGAMKAQRKLRTTYYY